MRIVDAQTSDDALLRRQRLAKVIARAHEVPPTEHHLDERKLRLAAVALALETVQQATAKKSPHIEWELCRHAALKAIEDLYNRTHDNIPVGETRETVARNKRDAQWRGTQSKGPR